MKTLMTVALLATALVASSALAGRDELQIQQQDRAIAAKRTQQAQGPAAAGPAGDAKAAKEGAPGKQLELLKRFHPKQAYGY